MALTDVAVKKAEPKERPYKLSDSGGLYLYVAPTGSKSWRMKFRLHDKEKLLTFGPYPTINLKQARDKRDEARAQLREHVDPSGARRRARERKEQARAAEARQGSFE